MSTLHNISTDKPRKAPAHIVPTFRAPQLIRLFSHFLSHLVPWSHQSHQLCPHPFWLGLIFLKQTTFLTGCVPTSFKASKSPQSSVTSPEVCWSSPGLRHVHWEITGRLCNMSWCHTVFPVYPDGRQELYTYLSLIGHFNYKYDAFYR